MNLFLYVKTIFKFNYNVLLACSSASQTPIKIFKTNSSSKISSKQCKINLNTLYEDETNANHLKSNTISCTYLTIDKLYLTVYKFKKFYKSGIYMCLAAINLMYNMSEDDLSAALVTPSTYLLPGNLKSFFFIFVLQLFGFFFFDS